MLPQVYDPEARFESANACRLYTQKRSRAVLNAIHRCDVSFGPRGGTCVVTDIECLKLLLAVLRAGDTVKRRSKKERLDDPEFEGRQGPTQLSLCQSSEHDGLQWAVNDEIRVAFDVPNILEVVVDAV
jgi:hypothetical protein